MIYQVHRYLYVTTINRSRLEHKVSMNMPSLKDLRESA
jgi:hypothetical protein